MPQAGLRDGHLRQVPLFYAASDVAFVGGSLVPVGGHNMLEPAALGLPVLFGPHVFNFAEISRMLLEVGAAWQVDGARELGEQALTLLQDANLRHNVGDRGRQFARLCGFDTANDEGF